MYKTKVKCIQTSPLFPEKMGATGALVTNLERGHAAFYSDNEDNNFCITFSTLQDLKEEGNIITLKTKNSTWVFKDFTH